MQNRVLGVTVFLVCGLAAGCGNSTGPASVASQQSVENTKKILQERPQQPVAGVNDGGKVQEAFPAAVVAAWQKVGAEVGWLAVGDAGWTFHTGAKLAPAELPAFRFRGEVPLFSFPAKPGASVAKLPEPPRACGLIVSDTQLTDQHLTELALLQNLQSLALIQTGVKDTGLKVIAGMKGLRALVLNEAGVTDVGLKALAGLKHLQTLEVTTWMTDRGLKELAGLSTLQVLIVSGSTDVTDRGLKELTHLRNLRHLTLTGPTRVTDAGIRRLQQALPALSLHR